MVDSCLFLLLLIFYLIPLFNSFLLSLPPLPHTELLQRKDSTKSMDYLKVLIVNACVPSKGLSHPDSTRMEKMSVRKKVFPFRPPLSTAFSLLPSVLREICVVQADTKASWLYFALRKAFSSWFNFCCQGKDNTVMPNVAEPSFLPPFFFFSVIRENREA